MPPPFSEIFFWAEITALGAAVFFYKKLRTGKLKTFPYYLAFIVLFEFVAFFLKHNRQFVTLSINYFVIPAEFIYLLFLLRHFCNSRILRKIILFCAVVYGAALAADILFFQHTYLRLFLRSYITGVSALVIGCCFCLYEIMDSDRVITFYKSPEFWVCTGILVFYMGSLPFHIYWNAAAIKEAATLIKMKNIFYLLMCTMYLFFTIGITSLVWKRD